MSVEIEHHSHVYIARMPDADDDWDRGDTASSLYSMTAHLSERAPTQWPGMSGQVFDVDALSGDIVYVIYADYDTGDTFGRDGNQIAIMDVFDNAADAITFQQGLLTHHRQETDAGIREVDFSAYEYADPDSGKKYYIPYHGHFEYLNGIYLKEVEVQ